MAAHTALSPVARLRDIDARLASNRDRLVEAIDLKLRGFGSAEADDLETERRRLWTEMSDAWAETSWEDQRAYRREQEAAA